LVCMHRGGAYQELSNYFLFASFLLTFLLPVILLFLPWCALLVQSASCCTRKLRDDSRAPFRISCHSPFKP
jgi:hypothetical protein